MRAKRHIEVRMTDRIYIYLHEDGDHVRTEDVPIPKHWWRPDDSITVSDAAIRRLVHEQPETWGWGRITDLDS